MTLTPESLAQAMGNSLPAARYRQLFPAANAALLAADCTTVGRAAMWMAQVGHESGGLRWMQELADGSAYNGRVDLGNTQPGDGPRFKGHGPIQITGRYNHAKVSEWAHAQGIVPTPTYFVDNPDELASDRYGFVGVTWYWTVARPMNTYADTRDILAATKAVNGGTNGLADRTARWDRCRAMGDAILPDPTKGAENMPENIPAISGDPVWLETVLRPALGDRLRTLPGWKDSGVGGTMGRIWGVIWHHTGNARESAQSIRDGRPDLAGPLAQIHIAPDGIVTIVAVGPCNHAGKGSWEGLPTDNANDRTIGVECAYPADTTLTEDTIHREPWPDAQIISMRDVGAALTKHLGVPVSHNISHAQWARFGPAGQRQYKWDPGNLDMDWFRGEIQKDIDGYVFPGETPAPAPPPPAPVPPPAQVDLLQWIVDQLGPGHPDWRLLGMNEHKQPLTLRDGLAALIADVALMHRKIDWLIAAQTPSATKRANQIAGTLS